MLATIRISIFLFITTLLFSCATQMSPEQVLQMQEREEMIIAEQLSRKLDPIEGIWLNAGSYTNQTIAIYKRGNTYTAQILNSGEFIFTINKKSEYEFYGDCVVKGGLELVEAKFRMVSVDDNTIDYVCARKNYITALNKILTANTNIYAARCLFCKEKEPEAEDFSQKIHLIRVYPESLKEHNSQY